MKTSSNVVGNSYDEDNFLQKLILAYTQASRLRKAFANNSTAKLKLSKTQLQKIRKSGEFVGRLSRPLIKTGLPLIGKYLNH